MHTLLLYVLKMMLCAALFHGYYFFFLRNERFHYYNRFYLLAGYILSILIPLPKMDWFTVESDNSSTIAWINILHHANGNAVVAQPVSFTWQSFALYASLCVSAFLLITLIYRIIKILRLKQQNNYIRLEDFDLINTEAREAPFSFMKNLFWRNDIDLDDTTGKQIMQHEITHIRQKHTWDKLFVETLLCVCWFNPFFWMMRKELWMIHEFIADQESVKDRDASAFAAMLLQSQYGKSIFAPAQSFSYSPVKRRLVMLTTSKQAKYSYSRKMMILPVFGAIIMLFACKLQQKEQPTKDEVVKANDTLQQVGKDTLSTRPSLESLVAKAVSKPQANARKTASTQPTTHKRTDQQQPHSGKVTVERIQTSTNAELAKVKSIPKSETTSKGYTALAWESKDSIKMEAQAITIKVSEQQQPLYIKDGTEISGAELSQLAPSTIESISVLKNESARSIYGSKGNYGVIIIKTRKPSTEGEELLYFPKPKGRVLDVRTKDN